MKTILRNTLALACLTLWVSCKEKPQQAQPAVESQPAPSEAAMEAATGPRFADASASDAWKAYMDLRLALVQTDAQAASGAAGQLAEVLGQGQPALGELAGKIRDQQDVEAQRALFSEFIGQSETFFTEALQEGTLYKQYCPMAFGNKGGYWFSDVDEIRNPYFGDKMLKCGTVSATHTK
ncbi:hypothetical protein OZ410_13715 [Robiginitalea sp. M366]|uniref:hypothetical protein n=1 Tax=Robiginitalea aestuariiviva TaxID=3036903 RepID=UPI00240DFD8C|nr:hypothetical protein [Robiginitalea aestuariiviva]MDG1573382.1 hypothetical protein [Robiginitalea aestuariiviva]